jgi:hypothetical protein
MYYGYSSSVGSDPNMRPPNIGSRLGLSDTIYHIPIKHDAEGASQRSKHMSSIRPLVNFQEAPRIIIIIISF